MRVRFMESLDLGFVIEAENDDEKRLLRFFLKAAQSRERELCIHNHGVKVGDKPFIGYDSICIGTRETGEVEDEPQVDEG